MRRFPAENELFNRALAELRGDEHRQIADAYDWSGVHTVVDVGGGAGSLLTAILETNKDTRGFWWSSRKCFTRQNGCWLNAESGVAASCSAAASSIPFPPGVKSGRSARFFTIGLMPIAAAFSRTAERPCVTRIGC